MERIAVVSHRLPPPTGRSVMTDGQAVALVAAFAGTAASWLGWDGSIAARPPETPRLQHEGPLTRAALSLGEDEQAGYLNFADGALWPLLHGRADLLRFEPSELAACRAVNDRFARGLACMLPGHAMVWVHDYQLIFVGQALRRLGLHLPIGFFLHVPFPAPDILSALPGHGMLLQALAAYDLVGFQTRRDLRNFHDLVRRQDDGAVATDGSIRLRGRRLATGTFPVGIATRRFEALAGSRTLGRLGEQLRGCFEGRLGLVSVDRLEYTKGLRHRLRAFSRLLETASYCRGRAMLLQVAAPSRETVPEYAALRAEIELLTGQINGRHAEMDWTPVHYINRPMSQARLAVLYRLCRVGLVTPLADGMNLVAKEYVASQDPEDPGVLVLSRLAGAAERMHQALRVNPYDIEEVAGALDTALRMPLDERRARWAPMLAGLRIQDVHHWRDSFLAALAATRAGTGQMATPAGAARAAGSSRHGSHAGLAG